MLSTPMQRAWKPFPQRSHKASVPPSWQISHSHPGPERRAGVVLPDCFCQLVSVGTFSARATSCWISLLERVITSRHDKPSPVASTLPARGTIR